MDGIGGDKMVYLEYETTTKQVVEIHEVEPTVANGYDYAVADNFIPGDEFEHTIWVNEVDENKNLISYSAIRNNPNAKKLLTDNTILKEQIDGLFNMVVMMSML